MPPMKKSGFFGHRIYSVTWILQYLEQIKTNCTCTYTYCICNCTASLISPTQLYMLIQHKRIIMPTKDKKYWLILPNSKNKSSLIPMCPDPGLHLRVMNLLEGPLISSALSFIGGVHIGARAPHLLNLIWFGSIACLPQWGGGGIISPFKWYLWYLPAFATRRGVGGRHPVDCIQGGGHNHNIYSQKLISPGSLAGHPRNPRPAHLTRHINRIKYARPSQSQPNPSKYNVSPSPPPRSRTTAARDASFVGPKNLGNPRHNVQGHKIMSALVSTCFPS